MKNNPKNPKKVEKNDGLPLGEKKLNSRWGNWIPSISLVLGLLGVVVGFLTWLYPNARKEMEFSLKSSKPILMEQISVGDAGVGVLVDGKEAKDPWIISFRVENSGNIPIEKKDIEQPLILQIPGVIVLAANSLSKSDSGLGVDLSISDDRVKVESGLLNPADWFEVDLLVDGKPSRGIVPSARISGVKRIEVVNDIDGAKVYKPAIVDIPAPVLVPASMAAMALGVLLFAFGATLMSAQFQKLLFPSKEARLVRRGVLAFPFAFYSDDEKLRFFIKFLPSDFRFTENEAELAKKLEVVDKRVFDVLSVTPAEIASQLINETKIHYLELVRSNAKNTLSEEGLIAVDGILGEVNRSDFRIQDVANRLEPVFEMYDVYDRSAFRRFSSAIGGGLSLAALGVFVVMLAASAFMFSLGI